MRDGERRGHDADSIRGRKMQIAERTSRIRRAPKAGNRSNRDALRIGFSCLLAAAAFLLSTVASADVVLLIGPDGAVLPHGTYRLVVIPRSAEHSVISQVIVVGSSAIVPTVPPQVIVPPPIVPDTPPKPDPTLPPLTTGVTYLVVIRENQDLTADQAAMLAKMRTWTDSQPERFSQLEIRPAAGGEDDRLRTYTERAGPLPWLVISRARTDGTGAAVLWSGELPGDLDAVKQRVAEVVK